MDKPAPISEHEYRRDFERPIPQGASRRREALQHALDIRKFEIELYWRRATYFWAFIAASLTAYGVVQNPAIPDRGDLSVVIGSLGFVFSFAWYCANRGSKQWQENWENHVDLLEDEVIGPLYKTVLRRPVSAKRWYTPEGLFERGRNILVGPGPFSVAKINQITSLFVTGLWVPMIWRVLPPIQSSAPVDWFVLSTISLAVVTIAVIWFCGTTDDANYSSDATRRISTIRPPNEPPSK